MEILLYSLLVINICLGYIIYNVYNKYMLVHKINTFNAMFIEHVDAEINKLYIKLKQVDRAGWFEHDDDVGFVFTELLRLIKENASKIENYNTELKNYLEKNVSVQE